MCGIGFTLIPQEVVSTSKNGVNKDGIALHQMVDERLQKNISFRGPDLPFSKKEYVYYNDDDEIGVLENQCQPLRSTVASLTTLNFYASVLHMQGATMVPQPLEFAPHSSLPSTDYYDGNYKGSDFKNNSHVDPNEEKYTFCWNGEAYYINDNAHSLNNNEKKYSDGDELPPWYDIIGSGDESRSDTQLVLDYIVSNVFHGKKRICRFNSGNRPQEEHRPQQKMDESHTQISNIMSNIHGEYSFILYSHQQGCVYFGRDPLGRRSLLMSKAKAQNEESLADDEVCVQLSKQQQFIVSSVALTSELQSSNDDNRKIVDVAHQDKIFPSIEMEEIPSGRVYCLDIKSGLLSYKNIHPKTNSNESTCISSAIVVPETESIVKEIKRISIEQASENLYKYLDQAVRRRVIDAPVPKKNLALNPTTRMKEEASVAILFSGGVDSVVLAALCHHHVPEEQPIDLINVAFANSKNLRGNKNTNNDAAFESSPDRQAALLSYEEMTNLWPSRKWRFVAVNVDYSEVLKYEQTICALIAPLSSTMDFNIGTAFWFASRGYGFERDLESRSDKVDKAGTIRNIKKSNDLRFSNDAGTKVKVKVQCSMKNCEKISQDGCIFGACRFCCGVYQRPINQYLGGRASLCQIHSFKKGAKKSKPKEKQNDNKILSPIIPKYSINIHSNAKVILIGIGADEQMAGYGRHRTAFNRGGYDALRQELAMEKDRLWTRNLGRDDRCISYHGKEARFPFLDEAVVNFLNSLDVEQLCDMTRPPGEGDKMILRLIAKKIGVNQCSGLVKRAIQFGSRIAKVSDTHRFGSSNKASGTATHR